MVQKSVKNASERVGTGFDWNLSGPKWGLSGHILYVDVLRGPRPPRTPVTICLDQAESAATGNCLIFSISLESLQR